LSNQPQRSRVLRPAFRGPESVLSSLLVATITSPEHATDGSPQPEAVLSAREAKAQAQSRERLREQRTAFRPVGIVIVVAVVVSASSQTPGLGLHGRSLWVTLSVVVFGLAVAWVIRDQGERSVASQAAAILVIGAAGVALSALQPHGATELAGAAAVFLAASRLPLLLAAAIAVGVTAALVATVAAAGGGAAAVIATALLCAMLFLVAWFVRQARAGQDRSELLLAQLEDARESQTAAAALEERSRIAGELHDVLAHSLSAAAIQLQGARVLAERDQAGQKVSEAIERASDLVRDGLRDARSAVGALRGDPLPGVAQLEELVTGFRSDVGSPIGFRVEGVEQALSADAGLALYRGAQEALTNAARYAPGASTSVTLRYTQTAATMTIENANAAGAAADGGLRDVGGGRGLQGMRERVEQLGGTMRAGPTEDGWRVELVVPY
jgi:signal transduction histidine kinase